MRLQLIMVAVACASMGSHSPAVADTSFASKVQVYADSDRTQVVSPVVEARSDVAPDTNVSVSYLVDVVSSASVDIISQASPKVIHDTRNQVATGIAQIIGPVTVHVGYTYSRENDYLSHGLAAGVSIDLFDKTTTLTLADGLGLNRVGRANDENFSRDLTVNTVSASWTQVISQRAIAQVTYELAHADGFQASPYRFVPVRASADASPDYWVAETDPQIRWRHAIVVGANHAIGATSSLQADYRLYHDTWGITSHTIGARYFVGLTRRLELRLRERWYQQGAASFYRSSYSSNARYITYDRELSPLWSETLGAKLTYHLAAHLDGELKVDAFYYSYSDFVPLASRFGTNVGLGIALVY